MKQKRHFAAGVAAALLAMLLAGCNEPGEGVAWHHKFDCSTNNSLSLKGIPNVNNVSVVCRNAEFTLYNDGTFTLTAGAPLTRALNYINNPCVSGSWEIKSGDPFNANSNGIISVTMEWVTQGHQSTNTTAFLDGLTGGNRTWDIEFENGEIKKTGNNTVINVGNSN